jgi:hypothetical protein
MDNPWADQGLLVTTFRLARIAVWDLVALIASQEARSQISLISILAIVALARVQEILERFLHPAGISSIAAMTTGTGVPRSVFQRPLQ